MEYREIISDKRGDFMYCTKDCGCKETINREPNSWVYWLIGFGLCLMLYVIYLTVDAIATFNAMIGQ